MNSIEVSIVVLVVCFFYFLPFIIAKLRESERSTQIFLINLFFGWTFVGWIIALIMGVGKNKNNS